MSKSWPKKEESEAYQIEGFMSASKRLPDRPELAVESKGERPDYVVLDRKTGTRFGVELTSVYLSDRSVPDVHMAPLDGWEDIPEPQAREIQQYQQRTIDAITKKVELAKAGYNTTHPLVLAIYVNEYLAAYLDEDDWREFVTRNEGVFDGMAPFSEIVFWNLPNDGVLRVRPGKEAR